MKFPKDRSREWKCVSRKIIWFFGETTYVEQRNGNTGTLKLAATNRNRKLLLNEAWKHYWTALFPNGAGWQSDLEAEILNRIYDPRDTHGFLNSENPKHERPAWAKDLEINFRDGFVAFKFLAREIVNVPLFITENRVVLSNWTNNNPLAKAASLLSVTDRGLIDCRGFLTSAVRECGSIIQGRLLAALIETEAPKFDIFCRLHDDIFSVGSKLPASGISAFSDVEIMQNVLTDRLRLPKLSDVHLQLRNQPEADVKVSKSFDEDDDLLIEEMKSLIDDKTEKSVRQAALAVLASARKMVDAQDNSIQQRLQRKFGKKYSGYLAEKN